MSRKSTVRESIFDEVSQVMDHVDPSRMRLIYDRVMVEDVPEDDSRRGRIWIPETCQDQTTIRRGRVVACGLGDKYTESREYPGGPVIREPIKCQKCNGNGGKPKWRSNGLSGMSLYKEPCRHCQGTGATRFPMSVKRGDIVLYNRRREAEIYIQRKRYSLVHEEQSVFAIFRGEELEPVQDRIIARREESVRNRQGSLYLPDTAVEKNREGIVLAVGPGRWAHNSTRMPMDVAVGDRVLFGKAAGSDIKVGGRECMILTSKDVLGVIG